MSAMTSQTSLSRSGVLVAVLTLALLGCHGQDRPAATAGAASDPWPQVTWPLAADPALEKRITDLMAGMTVEEKVGQLVQGDIASLTPEDVRRYRLGSILAGGNSDPGGRYDASPAEWLALADAFYDASMDTSKGGKAIPLLFGIDAVHGQSNIVGATLFPHNIGLGATRNPELLRQIGGITALETRVTGMEWTFAPTVAVPQDDRWGRSYEGYSESPEVVASYAGAMVEGLQGRVGTPEFLDGRHVIASVKHFLGDGGTTDGKDQGDTRISEPDLVRIHAAGYPPAIAAGAQTAMASFNSVNGEKMHGHRHYLTDVLKGRMNFGGFVVGDWNGHGQVKGCTTTDCPATINAGLDMAMASDSWKGFYETTLAAVKDGRITPQRLDDAVRRILRVKFRLGLFEAGRPSTRAVGGQFALIGAPAHRAVARQAVRESLVLLKNQNGVLPLSPKQRILVAGDGANDVGKQAGGWTLNWQGTGTTRKDFPNADSIYEGIARQARAAGGEAVLAVDGRYAVKPDVAVVVFGEDPYAEFQGDRPTLAYKPGNETDLALLKRLKADGIPVVAVFLSGRPLWVNREINAADAFVAAWLPGSEGAGIADVLLRGSDGRVQHDFKGKLSFSWPRTATQYANNVGQKDYDPLFAFGFGLTYADNGDLAALPEASGVTGNEGATGVFFARGDAGPGMALRLEQAAGQGLTVTRVPDALPDDRLKITGVDHLVQEDGRRLAWSGKGEAVAALQSHTALDLQRESNGDLMLLTTLRVDAAPEGEAWLSVGCGVGCSARIAIGPSLAALPQGQWKRVGVPLKCLAKAGAKLDAIDRPWSVVTADAMTISVSRVALGALNEAEVALGCGA
ncbi:glycoside hydrolase family 3 N-terminal domain-containing protein [Stenotrophomonas muris]|uniref:Exo 1,3/1,4-beta-D-glucan glucohydrolase n=1 Tax=Stenotrophomonas muris TaxID=2963283 RepID=A0ABU5MEG2_9GAMM|nr:exo 1,3/1,4-beta-D-glucan glucohydrolase [Stenotrophomonas muris]MBH1489402.1 exo 1,3/1,4-beta-D-glucan glucohydrolase [Stenotrophomonas maltophilia]MBH1570296.1 exo 1,3/1,4-beta-D-glucan glucohydrolase [Stenotrophomonas maltophilia]MBH1825693.1 exo 1,3/1,4-beta-D-glucan glucohydrolase [Stenotrophomonas maltophilia]MBN5040333.1 exo 1,3/1,4-beta-D-glucan glucohydrolase [Stenotrophomonas maltophilia]MBN5069903.1 exo 1,3/1,4-beta-D-glucan glucohydrolase [Stenotrophomonas maltophilia]